MSSTSTTHRTRAERVADAIKRVGVLKRMEMLLLENYGPLKLLLLVFSSLILCAVIQAWNPPFAYRVLQGVDRDIVCRTPFSVVSADKTKEARQNAKMEALHVYSHDTIKLSQFKAGLINTVQTLLTAESYEKMKEDVRGQWKAFLVPNTTEKDAAIAFEKFQKNFETDVELAQFKQVIDQVFLPYEKNGILIQLHGSREGNQERISVYDLGVESEVRREVPVLDVLIGNAYMIKDRLNQRYDRTITEYLFQWIRPMIPETLSENKEATEKAKELAAEKIQTVYTKYEPGQTILKAGQVIDLMTFQLLKEEYRNQIKARTWAQQLIRMTGSFVLLFLMFLLSYFFMPVRLGGDREKGSLRSFVTLYGLIVFTVVIGRGLQLILDNQGANPELIPLLIFAQTITLAYSWEEAIFTSFIATFVLALSGYFDLGGFLILLGTISLVIVMCRNIKTRGQIIFVAMFGGLTCFLLSYSIGLLRDQTLDDTLFLEASVRMTWALTAGFLFAGLLPFLERMFGILTPMRLLEIGNPSHPLLQKLAQDAPATYNHSIQCAALAEAAAEAIGARAALVRVGAYFHDIGKLLKPDYFTENQKPGSVNIHDSLEPRISTLVIVAHVKDGVNLGRQYHLPQQVIDLIEQHHGTTLVGFFFEKASESNRENGYGGDLDESSFRYPGPPPLSKEAGILMFADAVESACRSLGDASPGRIENLVRIISEKRMEDGQFDHAGLTLGEIRAMEKAIIEAVLAGRHRRVKYPGTDLKMDVNAKSDNSKPSADESKANTLPAQDDSVRQSESGVKNGSENKTVESKSAIMNRNSLID